MSKKNKEKQLKKEKRSAYSEYIDTMQEDVIIVSPPTDLPPRVDKPQSAGEPINSPYDISYEKTLVIDEEEDFVPPQGIINDTSRSEDYSEITTENLISEDLPFSIGGSSVQGKRKYQQDSIFLPDSSKLMKDGKVKFLCIISDGMGGLSSGDIASKTVVSKLSEDYYGTIWQNDEKIDRSYFVDKANMINESILDICDENGVHSKTGATLIAVEIDDDKLNFVNIGDSRIYFFRDGKAFQLTHDQNYLSKLMKMVEAGEITEQDARSHPKREALISFCGIDNLKLVETNVKPVALKDEDIILLCSDGLYRLLDEKEMLSIVESANNDMPLAAYRLTQAANNKNYRGQDNTSVIVIKVIHINNKEE